MSVADVYEIIERVKARGKIGVEPPCMCARCKTNRAAYGCGDGSFECQSCRRKCRAPGCERLRDGCSQLCQLHRKRLLRTGQLESALDCAVEGCLNPRRILKRGYSRGNQGPTIRSDFCKEHQMRNELKALNKGPNATRLIAILESGAFDFQNGWLTRDVKDSFGIWQDAATDQAKVRFDRFVARRVTA